MSGRLLRIITRMSVGGPSTHALLADRGLRHLGWETMLVHGVVEPYEVEVDLASSGLPTRRVAPLARPVRPAADARALAAIARIIREYRPRKRSSAALVALALVAAATASNVGASDPSTELITGRSSHS